MNTLTHMVDFGIWNRPSNHCFVCGKSPAKAYNTFARIELLRYKDTDMKKYEKQNPRKMGQEMPRQLKASRWETWKSRFFYTMVCPKPSRRDDVNCQRQSIFKLSNSCLLGSQNIYLTVLGYRNTILGHFGRPGNCFPRRWFSPNHHVEKITVTISTTRPFELFWHFGLLPKVINWVVIWVDLGPKINIHERSK